MKDFFPIRFLLRHLLNFLNVRTPNLLDRDLASLANLTSSRVKVEVLPHTFCRKEQVWNPSLLWLGKMRLIPSRSSRSFISNLLSLSLAHTPLLNLLKSYSPNFYLSWLCASWKLETNSRYFLRGRCSARPSDYGRVPSCATWCLLSSSKTSMAWSYFRFLKVI